MEKVKKFHKKIPTQYGVIQQCFMGGDQPTNQPLPIVGIALTHHFFKSGVIWNTHAKFQPNRFRNGDFSPFDQIDQPTDQPTTFYSRNSLNSLFFKSGAIWNIQTKFQLNRFTNGDFSSFNQIDGLTNQPTNHFVS